MKALNGRTLTRLGRYALMRKAGCVETAAISDARMKKTRFRFIGFGLTRSEIYYSGDKTMSSNWFQILSFEDGKYTVECLETLTGGNQYRVLRYGEEWQDFQHSKFFTLLFDCVRDLQKEKRNGN